MSQNSHHHQPLLVQAPVRALDPHGITVVTAGTVAFAIGTAVCWWFAASLAATGRLWYLWVAITGTLLGLLGLAFGLLRRSRKTGPGPRRSLDASVEEAVLDADGVPHRD